MAKTALNSNSEQSATQRVLVINSQGKRTFVTEPKCEGDCDHAPKVVES